MGEIVRTEKSATKKLIMIATVICSFFISFENVPEAAVMPGYERLLPVTANMNGPTAVALDKYECIFVAESVNNRLLVYSQNGRYMNTITGLNRPISVAVDNSIRVFIGNKDSGNVEAYDSNYNFLFKLGTGDGEFSQPNDIALSDTGEIYVVDKGEGKVKIYNADGTYNSSLGSPGSGDGEFNNPLSIAIDEGAGELIVLDRQLTQDMFGNSIEGARIQVFDISGVFKRSFSRYGNSIGEMFRPQHVAVDDQSRLYVTDSFHNVVLAYDRDGTYLGDIYDVANPMRTPLGITIGGSNRMYIASLSSGKVERYGIDAYTHMEVRPLSLNFQGKEGAGSPAAESVEIINNGTGVLSWTAHTNESWIDLSETAGTTQAAGIAIMDLSVKLNGLAAGTYMGTVSVSSSTGATEVIDIVLEVLPKPVLSVTPSSLTFTSTNGSYPSSQTLSITNAGAGMLDWTGSGDRSWILIDRTSGTAPENITVTVDITSLNAGTHTGSVTISGQGALSSPAIIPVTLNIVELTGAINVTANVAGAMFTINGPQSFSGSGVSWTETGVLTGTYAIVYGEIDGYIAPSAESKTLHENGTINFHGEYVSREGGQQGNHRSIIVGAGPGEQNTGLVKVFKSDGTEAGVEFTAHGYPYGVNVSAGDINYDGEDEIITAPGPGADNPAEVKIYNRDGVELEHLAITAFQYKYGAHVASGDFNGDGEHEVLVGAGAGKDNPSEVRVYVYDSTNNGMVDSGINLLAYSSGYGVQVAAGDIDNDGKDEIITSPGPGQDNAGVLRVWTVNSLSGIGQWDTEMVKEFTVTDFHGYSVRVGCGDVNGDGYAELITAAGPDPSGRDEIRIYDMNGEKVSEFRGYVAKRYGVLVGSGDLDNDGVAEIVVGAGPGSRNGAVAKIFDAYGIEQERFKAMRSLYGVNVAVGKLGL